MSNLYTVFRFKKIDDGVEIVGMHVSAASVVHATELFKNNNYFKQEDVRFFIQNDWVAEGNCISSANYPNDIVTEGYFKEWVYANTVIRDTYVEMK